MTHEVNCNYARLFMLDYVIKGSISFFCHAHDVPNGCNLNANVMLTCTFCDGSQRNKIVQLTDLLQVFNMTPSEFRSYIKAKVPPKRNCFRICRMARHGCKYPK